MFLERKIGQTEEKFREALKNSEKWLNIHDAVNISVIFHISLSENSALFLFSFLNAVESVTHRSFRLEISQRQTFEKADSKLNGGNKLSYVTSPFFWYKAGRNASSKSCSLLSANPPHTKPFQPVRDCIISEKMETTLILSEAEKGCFDGVIGGGVMTEG